jgi:5'-nucleotidase (lipoprotein e(P4) family)
MRNVLMMVFIMLVLVSCNGTRENGTSQKDNQDPLLLPVLWFQKSGEMQALYYQGYNIAKSSLEEKIKKSENKRHKAVIMDIDETVLDNSPVEAYQAINNVPFSDTVWNRWVNLGSAEPLPGAVDFTKFAESKGVEIFYITNRAFPGSYKPTIENLRNKGFPFADTIHLVLKKEGSSKKTRRDILSEKYDILLLIGDNLADFDDVFDNRGVDLSFGAVKNKMNEFGSKFIILPNPMYGPWINSAIKNQPGSSTKEKLMKSIYSF